jgi:hypothetical protein
MAEGVVFMVYAEREGEATMGTGDHPYPDYQRKKVRIMQTISKNFGVNTEAEGLVFPPLDTRLHLKAQKIKPKQQQRMIVRSKRRVRLAGQMQLVGNVRKKLFRARFKAGNIAAKKLPHHAIPHYTGVGHGVGGKAAGKILQH